MARWLRLMGRDYPELGPLGSVGFPDGGGLALSRGLYPKSYKHTDPNEDGALVYRKENAALLAVVDGYNGAAASEVALDLVCARAETLLEASGEAFAEAIESLVHTAQQAVVPVAPAHTCLVLAALRGNDCHWANFGDSSLFRSSQPEPVHGENNLVLGANWGTWPRGSLPWWGTFRLEPGERIFAVSDGVTNFVPDPRALSEFVRSAADDRTAALDLATRAMEGGAGDNVAAAVVGNYPPVSPEVSAP